jgi:hypothetical protein
LSKRSEDPLPRLIPCISLAIAAGCALVAWKRRDEFAARPYFHWFIYLPLTAVGLHQFEEYGWPGGFRNAYVGVFPFAAADALVPSLLVLELFNSFGLMLLSRCSAGSAPGSPGSDWSCCSLISATVSFT